MSFYKGKSEVFSFADKFNSICGNNSFPFPNDGELSLSYSSSSPIPVNSSCIVSVFSQNQKYPANVIAYFSSFVTDVSQNCTNSRMDIYDGRGVNSTKSLTGMYFSGQFYINVREYRRGNRKWTIQRNWQHRVHKTKN